MTLYIFRGLPGCGKSTKAREMQRVQGGVVVERDEIRFTLYGTYHDPAIVDEKLVSEYQNAMIDMSLQMNMNVFVSDMNLRNSYVKALIEKAWKFKQEWEVVDLTNVPLVTCLLNNESHERQVQGKVVDRDVIRDLHARFINGQPHPLPLYFTGAKVEKPKLGRIPYLPTYDLPKAILVDIDGTVARMHNRGPFEEDKVGDDLPIENVMKMVEHAALADCTIVFMSGRTDGCEGDTEDWLLKHMPWLDYGDVWWELHMRRSVEDRGRPDDDVKYDLFMDRVARRFHVLYVLDDRNKVVKMWREIGLTCAQVAEGDF